MKQGLAILFGILAIGFVAATLSCLINRQTLPMQWLQREFSMSPAEANRIAELQKSYQRSCMGMCGRIRDSDQRLAQLIGESTNVTPELSETIAATDRIRTECRIEMLRQCYAVAAAMPADQRQHYLKFITPIILQPGASSNTPHQ